MGDEVGRIRGGGYGSSGSSRFVCIEGFNLLEELPVGAMLSPVEVDFTLAQEQRRLVICLGSAALPVILLLGWAQNILDVTSTEALPGSDYGTPAC
ncbi:hypothetical protein NMY22_g5521 [Coprinellus aureogranulatus]|nr:hypothetical protein NMY22_g5521 [Coprinellus aureogranulatus]